MADVILADVEYRRILRRERVFKDRLNPLETLSRMEVKSRFRFYPETIIYLVHLLNDHLKRATKRSFAIPVLIQVLVALRFYASGAYYLVVGDTIQISESTVCRCVRRVSLAICNLSSKEIIFPDVQYLPQIKNKFYEIAGFPNVVGCVDGCLVQIKKPHLNTQDYICRKGFAAINTQVCCGPDNIIYYASVKWPGAVHDSRVFEESTLRRIMEEDNNGVLLGDSAYAIRPYMLTPFPLPTTPQEMNYNRSLCKTRVKIEMTFGIIKNRFGCMLQPIRVSTPSRACTVIQACFVLHNIATKRRDNFEPLVNDEDTIYVVENNNNDTRSGKATRRSYVERYF